MLDPAEKPSPLPRETPLELSSGAGRSSNLPSLGQLTVSAVGLAFFSIGFIILLLAALLSLGAGGDLSQSTTLFAMAWTSAGAALLMLPSIVYAVLRLSGKPREGNPFKGIGRYLPLALVCFPVVLAAGTWLTAGEGVAMLLASPLNLLAVGIPLWVLFELSTRGLTRGSPQRGWGVLSFGMTVVPVVTMLVEVLVILLVAAAALFWAVKSDPANLLVLNRVQMRIAYAGMNSEVFQRLIQTYLSQPFVFYTVLSIFSGFIPLVEESLKPMALWFLINRRLSPVEGFTAGLISGLAFSVIESTNAMAVSVNSSWALMAVGRLGAGLLHMTTAALMGWALASTFKDGRYFRLVFSFLTALLLHGLWNGLTLLTAVAPQLPAGDFLKSIGQVAPEGLVLLMGVLLLILLGWNQILKRQSAAD